MVSYKFILTAQEHLDNRRYAEAIELCREGIKYYPRTVAAYGILAKALLQSEGADAALAVLDLMPGNSFTPKIIEHFKDSISLSVKQQAEQQEADEIDIEDSEPGANEPVDEEPADEEPVDEEPVEEEPVDEEPADEEPVEEEPVEEEPVEEEPAEEPKAEFEPEFDDSGEVLDIPPTDVRLSEEFTEIKMPENRQETARQSYDKGFDDFSLQYFDNEELEISEYDKEPEAEKEEFDIEEAILPKSDIELSQEFDEIDTRDASKSVDDSPRIDFDFPKPSFDDFSENSADNAVPESAEACAESVSEDLDEVNNSDISEYFDESEEEFPHEDVLSEPPALTEYEVQTSSGDEDDTFNPEMFRTGRKVSEITDIIPGLEKECEIETWKIPELNIK